MQREVLILEIYSQDTGKNLDLPDQHKRGRIEALTNDDVSPATKRWLEWRETENLRRDPLG